MHIRPKEGEPSAKLYPVLLDSVSFAEARLFAEFEPPFRPVFDFASNTFSDAVLVVCGDGLVIKMSMDFRGGDTLGKTHSCAFFASGCPASRLFCSSTIGMKV